MLRQSRRIVGTVGVRTEDRSSASRTSSWRKAICRTPASNNVGMFSPDTATLVDVLDERRLADARFTAEKDHPACPAAGIVEPLVEAGDERRAFDQLHLRSLRRA